MAFNQQLVHDLEAGSLGWDAVSLFYVMLAGLECALVVSWQPHGLTYLMLGWLLTRAMAVIRPHGTHHQINQPGLVHMVVIVQFSKQQERARPNMQIFFYISVCVMITNTLLANSRTNSKVILYLLIRVNTQRGMQTGVGGI